MKRTQDERTDPYFVGLLAAAIAHALRALEHKDVAGARVILRENLDDLLRSELMGRDPQFRETLQRL
jgi:hypothetical protein